MQIKHFELAHCSLFRQPPIDFSAIETGIQERILKAWEKGSSVDGVIHTLLKDPVLVNQIASQISENFDYQREIGLGSIQTKKETALEQYWREKEERERRLQSTYDPAIAAHEALTAAARKKVEATGQSYSAAQARLEEMRTRINARLKKVGGAAGLEQLVRIQEGLDGISTEQSTIDRKSHSKITKQISKPEYPTTLSTQKKSASPPQPVQIELIKTRFDQEQVIETSYKKESRIKRIGAKVWSILNYKLW